MGGEHLKKKALNLALLIIYGECMLINFQFSFSDLRNFVEKETYKIDRPSWEDSFEYEFIKACGYMRERKNRIRRDVRYFPRYDEPIDQIFYAGENQYCLANTFIKFPALEKRGDIRCAFRRIFTNDIGVSRLEVGFDINPHLLTPQDFASIIPFLLELEVLIPGSYKKNIRLPLYDINKEVGKKYLYVTTFRKKYKKKQFENWWIQEGKPLLIILLEESEKHFSEPLIQSYQDMYQVSKEELGRHSLLIQNNHINLYHLNYFPNGRKIESWCVVPLSKDEALARVLKQLRTSLHRIHSEKRFLYSIEKNFQRLSFHGEYGKDQIQQTIEFLVSGKEAEIEKSEQSITFMQCIKCDKDENERDYVRLKKLWKKINLSPKKPNKDYSKDVKSQIIKLIEGSHLRKAFALMEENMPEDSLYKNELIHIKSQYSNLEKNDRLNIINTEAKNLQRNIIINNILNLIDEIFPNIP